MLIIFIVLSGVWITCGTIFVVRDVEIIDTTAPAAKVLTESEKKAIIKTIDIKNKNILFNLNQEKIAASVKSVSPMLKLQNVTAEFPNRVVLTVARRVPVYSDGNYFYDAEMCVVEGTATDCIDISGVNLTFTNREFEVGDHVIGGDARSQCKIDQLKIIAGYFPSLKDFNISYDDRETTVGGKYVCLMLKLDTGVTFKIKTKPGDNFLQALKFTDQIYKTIAVEGYPNRVYKTMFRYGNNPNKVATEILDADGNNIMKDNGKDVVYYEK